MREPENDDGRPGHGDPSDRLPGLPEEWGRIVIPDDPAALAAEAEAVRRELRARSPRPATGTDRAALGGSSRYAPAPRLPLLVLAIAVLATLASLLAAVLPGQPRPAPGQSREPDGHRAVPADSADPAGRPLPALEVADEHGSTLALRSLLPAVIIFMEECECPASVTAAASAVPPGVTVVALFSGVSAPSPLPSTGAATNGVPVRSLADPAAGLRRFLRAPARPGEAATLLVARSGEIVRFLPAPTSTADYQADLARLAPA